MFRGVHLEQHKLAALRVFTIPMGMTPEVRREYADQLEELKSLRHPGIVRCFGGGYDSSVAFLAYELVDGESLEAAIERRERLPWETVFEFSQQLAEALQYAHERDWVHGRLKPDKILLSRDGDLKIGDWRREAIAAALGSGKPTHLQLLYTAPECLEGGEPNHKSDLYSLGAILFYMLTGQPPYNDEPQRLRERILSEEVPDVRSFVLDCPVWFSSIVNQLLSRDPAERPFSATALLLAFKEARKRQAEGVGVLQHATAGFSPLKVQADRDEAEKVLGIRKKKRKKKASAESFLEQTWVLVLSLLLAIGCIVWFLMPPGESTLVARAESLLPPSSERWTDWNKAKDRYLVQLVERFPEGESAAWAKEQLEWIAAREASRRLERQNRFNERAKWSDADRQYWSAWEYEQFGDYQSALDKYRALRALYEGQKEAAPVCYLAQEAIQRIESQGDTRSELSEYIDGKLAEAQQAYEDARIVAAREMWESILELYADNEELQPQVEVARQRLSDLKDR